MVKKPIKLPSTNRVRWLKAHRVVSTRYPPVDLYERVADEEDWADLHELEMLTNPRIREDMGAISYIPKERRVFGAGASHVMAPFAYRALSRFSDGTFGVYYAAKDLETALLEVAHHRGIFLADTSEEAMRTQEKVMVGKVDTAFHDVRKGPWKRIHDPDSYIESRKLGTALREEDSKGVVFNSVRKPGGENIAVFWPNAIEIPVETKKIAFQWDGERITKWFDYESGDWKEIQS